MLRNGLKRLWMEGRPAINGWLSIGSPFVAEIMAAQDYDSVTVDVQHGNSDPRTQRERVPASHAPSPRAAAQVFDRPRAIELQGLGACCIFWIKQSPL